MKRKESNKKKIFFLIITLLILSLVFFLRRNTDNFLQKIIIPPAKFFSSAGAWSKDRVNLFLSIGEIKNENNSLKEENLKIKSQIAILQDTKVENEQLRKALELAPKEKYKLKAALIIGQELSGQKQILTINQGKEVGIKEGLAVVVGKGVLVGRVIKTFSNSSLVQLIFDRNSRISAEIIESGLKGIVIGRFGTSANIEMLPQTEEIKKGDTIITSGDGDAFPRGLLMGYVKEASPTADQLFQQASIAFPYKLEEARMVWVVFP